MHLALRRRRSNMHHCRPSAPVRYCPRPASVIALVGVLPLRRPLPEWLESAVPQP